ncbi:MAG: LytR/AlgR family response regulator transcription factor [Bacteroidota bacterium]
MKTLLIDDERLARKGLTSLLQHIPDIDVVGEAANVDEALKQIDKLKPDLLFLDIEMPERSGFDLLEELIDVPHVIFVTAYNEFAIHAFEVNALDYILKPVSEVRLQEAVQRVRKVMINVQSLPLLKDMDEQVFIRDGEKCWFVKLADIRLIESVGNYARIYFDTYKPLIHKTLNALDERLGGKRFFRANRQQIVNLSYVDKIESAYNGGIIIVMKDQTRIEISRRQSVKFKEMMSL